MGDYLKNGAKIGTCGRAYYATRKQLEKYAHEEEAAYYLNPKNSCSFAFPFPEYDGKDVGQFSNFHEGERAEYFFSLPAGVGLHGKITHHVHPRGGAGINLFIPCPYTPDSSVSNNFDRSFERFRLVEEVYYSGELRALVECIYCGERQILDEEETIMAARDFERQALEMEKQSDREKVMYPDCSNWETSRERATNLRTVSARLMELICQTV